MEQKRHELTRLDLRWREEVRGNHQGMEVDEG